MAVSSKSIIHYTDNIDNLKGIINDGHLRLKYCSESIGLYDGTRIQGAYPMVCFCDLPLTLAKEHIKKYGSYAIGFSKVWARSNRLNPVFYLEANSAISKYITEMSDEQIAGLDAAALSKLSKEERGAHHAKEQEFARLLAFCKNHEGPLVRRGKVVEKNYVFYDEREWRHVPDLEKLGEVLLGLNADNYDKKRDHYNTLLNNHHLSFEHSDISYIIVKNESDINIIAKSLNAKYGDDLNPPIMRRLLTKIISVQQIEDDF